MTSGPSFVLTGPAGTLAAEGIRVGYRDVAAAAAALRDGSAGLVVGALPFDGREPAALLTPVRVQQVLPARPSTPMPVVRIAENRPSPAVHRSRVESALLALDFHSLTGSHGRHCSAPEPQSPLCASTLPIAGPPWIAP